MTDFVYFAIFVTLHLCYISRIQIHYYFSVLDSFSNNTFRDFQAFFHNISKNLEAEDREDLLSLNRSHYF